MYVHCLSETMQTRSQTRAGKAASSSKKSKIVENAKSLSISKTAASSTFVGGRLLPIPMAARTRLYKIIKGNLVVNAEGHTIRLPPDDFRIVGAVDETEHVSRASMTKLARNISGYFHISFLKADGSLRNMYAHANGSVYNGNSLSLVDLEVPASEYRSCCVDRIVSITKNGVHFYI